MGVVLLVMDGEDSHGGATGRSVSRRDFVKAAGATGIATGLAGCTALGGETGANRVQWMAGSNEVGVQGDIRKALYNAGLSRDVEIEIVSGPSNTSAKQQLLQRWLDAKLENPDLILMDSGWAIPFIVRGQALNLTQSEAFPDSYVRRIENQYFESSVRTAKHPLTGDLYGVPLFPDFPTMQYRKDLVKKAGYSPERENWATQSMHWKKFAQITKEVKEQNNLDYGFTFQASSYEGLSCCDFNEFMTSWGGAYFGGRDNLFGPVGKRPVTVNQQGVIDSIRMIRTFIAGPNAPGTLNDYAGNISPRAVLSWIEEPSRAPFASGNAAMHRNWPYAISLTLEEADWATPETYGVMPIPYAVTDQQSQYQNIGGPVAALGGWHNVINPYSDKIDQCVQVLEAMAKPSFKFKMFELLGYIPPEPDLLDSRRARQVPLIGNYVKQLRIAGENAIPRPVTVVWPQESTKIAQIVNNSYAGEIAPEQAMATLQSQLKAIENYNQ